ncbi:unnamed protein product [Ophioblennius macclurei]
MNTTLWLLISLAILSVDSSPLSSSTLRIFSAVGNEVELPCSWRTHLGVQTPPECHVQWANPTDIVFELKGDKRFEAEEFQGRLQVPENRLGSGDCSLIITDVQLQDSGNYDGFMVVDGKRSRKTRVFIQSVTLSVQDHKTQTEGHLGGQVDLELHTRHSVRLVFQSRNSSDWSEVWRRGEETRSRLKKVPDQERLTLKRLKRSDTGTYKVLDEHGLSVSTVQLTVEEELQNHNLPQIQDTRPTGIAGKCSSSVLLLLASLAFCKSVLL